MISTEQSVFSSLSLQQFRCSVQLGCEEIERNTPQFVNFDVKVRFSKLPASCESDSLQDTICYAELCTKLRGVCERAPYHLIEKLGWDAYRAVQPILPRGAQLWLRVNKEKPPVPNLDGGTSFTVGEWEIH